MDLIWELGDNVFSSQLQTCWYQNLPFNNVPEGAILCEIRRSVFSWAVTVSAFLKKKNPVHYSWHHKGHTKRHVIALRCHHALSQFPLVSLLFLGNQLTFNLAQLLSVISCAKHVCLVRKANRKPGPQHLVLPGLPMAYFFHCGHWFSKSLDIKWKTALQIIVASGKCAWVVSSADAETDRLLELFPLWLTGKPLAPDVEANYHLNFSQWTQHQHINRFHVGEPNKTEHSTGKSPKAHTKSENPDLMVCRKCQINFE